MTCLTHEPIQKVVTYDLIPQGAHSYSRGATILDLMAIVLLSPWFRNDSQLCPTNQGITERQRKLCLIIIIPENGEEPIPLATSGGVRQFHPPSRG